MHDLSFRPIAPTDLHDLQAMIQGDESFHLPFNILSFPCFLAVRESQIVGLTLGKKDMDVLMISGTYLKRKYDDDAHRHELHLAFINWATNALHVHSYQLGKNDEAKPIGFSYSVPVLSAPQQSQLPEFTHH
jgi:hypothetical protein